MPKQQIGWVGDVQRVPRKKGDVWLVDLRIPRFDGGYLRTDRTLGLVWDSRGSPPPGHYTRKQAEEWRQTLIAKYVVGRERAPSGVRFAEVANDWLAACREERRLRFTTLRDYESSVRTHFVPAFGDLAISDVDAPRIREWVRQMNSRGASARTVKKNLTYLHNVMAFAVQRYGLDANPIDVVESPRDTAPRKMNAYTIEQALAIIDAASSQRDATLLAAALFAGLRKSEIRALEWRDVSFDRHVISVVRSYSGPILQAPKSGHHRSVPLLEQLETHFALLKEEIDPQFEDVRIFSGDRGGVMNESVISKMFRRAVTQAGVPPYTFHELRHTFGTLAASVAPINTVKEWMGHADIDTTMGYLHFIDRPNDREVLAQAFNGQVGLAQIVLGQGVDDIKIA